ncbi:monofunctional biosynthetic peptidoglycan transglycosylase [Histidinibacterium aquaticum]|uniref:Biosynthetic peptidoglycan transglycosylase n=1 Tax=Histidinibacterium aquaticum TaxID=2613962 RepID=A0A5J5GFZ6_9RHOB|nr:monofunctional biosynthetic peptidoglycan transglycosylase [Histidinibacterium aquaticum]KAA9006682.1 monofunctional biosynthetic peptidoglycan transglycosylase [Histidinibacterium aquaticum]
MAKRAKKSQSSKSSKPADRGPGPLARVRRWTLRLILGACVLTFLIVSLFAVVDPPTTPYMIQETHRLDRPVTREWVDMEDIAPVMARAAVAAEDADFCRHWGLDVTAIRAAMEDGGKRGGSTISQQVVKNLFLWHGRSYVRKALEAGLTPVMEAVWPKRRILEVYLNIAEFDEGIFGVEAASQHYFGIPASELSPTQAGLLASLLPAPKVRSASEPSSELRDRAGQIVDGAATIARDGRAACFEMTAG